MIPKHCNFALRPFDDRMQGKKLYLSCKHNYNYYNSSFSTGESSG